MQDVKRTEITPGLVSVVVPVFNRPALVERAVASVAAQGYRPLEIIVVDDGSNDGKTPAVCDGLAQHYGEMRAIHQIIGGPGSARETGRCACRGEFIQYLDSDDELLPGKLEAQVQGLRRHSECGVSYCRTEFVSRDGSGAGVPWKRTGEQFQTLFPSFLEDRWWGTSTPLYRAAALRPIGPWTGLRANEDWEYDCRLAAAQVRLQYVPEILSRENDHGGPRLSGGGAGDPAALHDRALARRLILAHAHRAGLGEHAAEMQTFAAATFLLARQCGAAGLPQVSRELMDLARDASPTRLACSAKFRLYRFAGASLGWALAGRLARLREWFPRTQGCPRPAA